MPHAFLVLLYLSFLLTTGCDTFGLPVKIDLSTPRSAALEYLQAVQRGDARSAHAASFGTSAQEKWVDGRITMVDGMRKFDDALYAKFGRFTSQVHTDMHDTLYKLADVWVLAIKDGTLDSTETQARIDPKKGLGFFAREVTSVYLERKEQKWKVDLAKTYADGVPPAEYASLNENYRQIAEYGQIFRDVAKEINAGRFQSADAAAQELSERMAALYKSEKAK